MLILRSPFFWVGLIPKVTLIFFWTPELVSSYYGPFLLHSINQFSLDPWQSWEAAGGWPEAFPYGYAMWAALLPAAFLSGITTIPMSVTLGVTFIAADTALLNLLRQVSALKLNWLTLLYWCSPVVFLATYVLGSTDLIPVIGLVASIIVLRRGKYGMAGVLLAVAISAKLSMLLALPFVAIYFLRNKSVRRHFAKFSTGFVSSALVLLVPHWLLTTGGKAILGNQEIQRLLFLTLPAGANQMVYLMPLVFAISLYASWRVKRMNFDLFVAMLGIAFLLVVVLSPSTPGWYVWAVPFLVLFIVPKDSLGILLYAAWSALYVLAYTLSGVGDQLTVTTETLFSRATEINPLAWTALIAVTLIIAYRTLRARVVQNDYFRLSRKPLVIGIAGDSGSGKDTLAESLVDLFGTRSVAHLSGDDYHRWDRHKPMWRAFTHLNPAANDLEGFTRDVLALAAEETILNRHYNHSSGKMSRLRVMRSNDIIIASGLHALYLPPLLETFTLSIYLDMDEQLRRHLKINRDTNKRGHALDAVMKSIEERVADAEKYIYPQSQYADLALSLLPATALEGADSRNGQIKLALRARFRSGVNDARLSRVLVGLTALQIDTKHDYESGHVEMYFSGECWSEDIELATKELVPHLLEFLDAEPEWRPGVAGIMQLLVLVQLDEALTRRMHA